MSNIASLSLTTTLSGKKSCASPTFRSLRAIDIDWCRDELICDLIGGTIRGFASRDREGTVAFFPLRTPHASNHAGLCRFDLTEEERDRKPSKESGARFAQHIRRTSFLRGCAEAKTRLDKITTVARELGDSMALSGRMVTVSPCYQT